MLQHLPDGGGGPPMSSAAAEPIAIVGLACRLPGDIGSPEDLWHFLAEGCDARRQIPETRYRPSKTNPPYGYFLDRDLQLFDPTPFTLSRSEATQLDPVQRQLLEVVQECLDSAGEANTSADRIGCFVGTFSEDWQDLRRKDPQEQGPYRLTGSSDFASSNRISFEFDLKGPSVTYRSACSASMVALHSACQALQQRDCSSAVVAGANLILSEINTTDLASVGALSPAGSCKTFDASADGYARGEGVSVIYIKKLTDAVANNDPIRAVIRATASNSDGRSASFSQPHPEAHETLMRHAYDICGLDPSATAFVEMHGTGTAVGDPLEAQAVAKVFGGSTTLVGSIKPNIGHAEGASGLSSIIKSVLALENATIPPNIKLDTPNSKITFHRNGLTVPLKTTPWPSNKTERISVNSFGLGGANAHAILDAARLHDPRQIGSHNIVRRRGDVDLLAFSAARPESVTQSVERTRAYLKDHPMSQGDVAHTLNNRRRRFAHRSFALSRGDTIIHASPPMQNLPKRRTIFVFTGQGAQSLGMGASLIQTVPSFEEDLRQVDDILAQASEPPSWSVRDLVSQSGKSNALVDGDVSQPLCIAVQIALVNLLARWGITPDAVVGHSSGEVAAAYAAGALSMPDAVRLALARGQSLKAAPGDGAMAAVELSRHEVQEYLSPGVLIGCENSPSNVTLSGDAKALYATVARIEADKPETFARKLKVDHGYHSQHMMSVAEAFEHSVGGISFRRPKVPFFSTALGRLIEHDEVLDVAYWKANIVQPVLFSSAIQDIAKAYSEPAVFVEVGPHTALRGPLRQCWRHFTGKDPIYVPTLVRNEDAYVCLLKTAGTLHCLGVEPDMAAITSTGRVLPDLPSYQWHYERLWTESRISRAWRFPEHPRHELLGSLVLEHNKLEPTWRNLLRESDILWLSDHCIGSKTVYPAAAYVAMAGECMRQLHGNTSYTVKDVEIRSALVLQQDDAVEIMTGLKPHSWSRGQPSHWYEFTITSVRGEEWTQHCSGLVRPGAQEMEPEEPIQRLDREVDSGRLYQQLGRCGLRYGPAFQRLQDMASSMHEQTATGFIRVDAADDSYALHPASIDTLFQALIAASVRGQMRNLNALWVPTAIGQLSVSPAEISLSISATATIAHDLAGSATAWSAGKVVMDARNLKMSCLEQVQPQSYEIEQSGAKLVFESLPWLREDDERGERPDTLPATIAIVSAGNASAQAQSVQDAFVAAGLDAQTYCLDEAVPVQDILVLLLDVAAPFLFKMDDTSFSALRDLLGRLQTHQKLLWVTPSGITDNNDPQHALTLGFIRTMRLEMQVDFAVLETGPLTIFDVNLLPRFVRQYRRYDDPDAARDYEYSLVGGKVMVPRYEWYDVATELQESSCDESPAMLSIEQPGVLSSLAWKQCKLPAVSDREVTIDVATVGTNFRDVLTAMGVVSAPSLGLEAAGTVTNIGASIEDLEIGDRVAVLNEGCFTTTLTVPRSNCVRIPDTLSFEEAASVYGVFCTNVLALLHIARLQPGMTVLVHSACGGIGLSALQICQLYGAEIFATVGHDAKRQHLQRHFNMRADHIFDSHSTSFREGVLRATNGEGVDIVLNSLSGEFLAASWECVAEFGIMLELGKRDIEDGGLLQMNGFSGNRGYRGVDLAHVITHRPALCAKIMRQVTDLLIREKIHPIDPIRTVNALDIEQCFRGFQKGDHIGKTVVRMPQDLRDLQAKPSRLVRATFNPKAAYLLVGGLGGLGRAVSLWMAERGARHLTYLSRSAGDSVSPGFLRELNAWGCECSIVKGDVADAATVSNLFRSTTRPILGIMQMAMALNDYTFSQLSFTDWQSTMAPKVSGTLNLHAASLQHADQPLDFFVLFSSQNALHGWPGQSNYAAANTFLDSFAAYRQSQGLAASSLALGPVRDIGFVSQDRKVLKNMGATCRLLPEEELLRALDLAVLRSHQPPSDPISTAITQQDIKPTPMPCQLIPGLHPFTNPKAKTSGMPAAPWHGDARFAAYRDPSASSSSCTEASPRSSRQQNPSSPANQESTLRALLSSLVPHDGPSPTVAHPAANTDPAPSQSASTTHLRAVIARAIHAKITSLTGDAALDPAGSTTTSNSGAVPEELETASLQRDLGLDSLLAIEFRGWWRRVFGGGGDNVSVLDVLGAGTVGGLAEMGVRALTQSRG